MIAIVFALLAQPAASQRVPVPIEQLGRLSPDTGADAAWEAGFPLRVQPLLRRWMQFNSECRGGPGDRVPEENMEEWMTRVCSARDAASLELRFHGYCYGRRGEAGAEHEWHACTSISNGNDYFAD
ncbi:MAG TPA: hypothetical protein VGB54_02500 [Allosphingosinicella sp.]|jgi:hypothetical protein